MSEAIVSTLGNVVKAAIVLFIIVDPFGNVPIFMGLTQKLLMLNVGKFLTQQSLLE